MSKKESSKDSKPSAIIDRFFELQEEVWKLVGCDGVHYPGVIDGRDYVFCLTDNTLTYGTPGDDSNSYGGDIYGTAIFRGKKYTIAVYDNGCGDRKCPVLLTNKKAVSEWED